MSHTLPDQLRPRRAKKKPKFRFMYVTLILVVTIAVAIIIFSSNAAKLQEKQEAVRTPYNLGAILEINFSDEDLASNLQALSTKLNSIKSAGFDTLLLPPLQPGQDVTIGDETIRAVSDWQTIDAEYGDENQLKELVRKADENEQKILLTLPTGLITKANSWATTHPNWLAPSKQKDEFFLRAGIDKASSESLELIGGRGFLPKSYVEIVDYWESNFAISGVRIQDLPLSSPALNARALDLLRTEKLQAKNFVTISDSNELAGRVNSGFSATTTDDVERILGSIESKFDPDALALAVGKAMDYKAGPTIIHSNFISDPNYFMSPTKGEGQVNLSTALAYALPGVPKVKSNLLVSSAASNLYSNLNKDFNAVQMRDDANAQNKVEFFIASEDGTAGFAITRNGNVIIIIVNANTIDKSNASFSVPQKLRGTYLELENRLSYKVTEDFEIMMNGSSVRIFMKK